MITLADVETARARTTPYVRRTPQFEIDPIAGARVWLKAEFLQRCGVFKTWGAFNRQLAARERGDLDPAVGIVSKCSSWVEQKFDLGSANVRPEATEPRQEPSPSSRLHTVIPANAGISSR